MTSPHEPIVPSKDFRGISGIAQIANFVMETDWSAGQVIKAIDNAGVANNTIVNHSNHGELAYRDGPWKLVFKVSGNSPQQSRGKPHHRNVTPSVRKSNCRIPVILLCLYFQQVTRWF